MCVSGVWDKVFSPAVMFQPSQVFLFDGIFIWCFSFKSVINVEDVLLWLFLNWCLCNHWFVKIKGDQEPDKKSDMYKCRHFSILRCILMHTWKIQYRGIWESASVFDRASSEVCSLHKSCPAKIVDLFFQPWLDNKDLSQGCSLHWIVGYCNIYWEILQRGAASENKPRRFFLSLV